MLDAPTSIKIEDIRNKNDVDDGPNAVEKLSKIVDDYGRRIENKDREIFQLKNLIISYEETIKDLELQSSNLKEEVLLSNDFQNESSDKNLYVSSLMRKLEHTQESYNKERAEKHRLSLKVREFEKRMNTQSYNQL